MNPARCRVCGKHASQEPGTNKGEWLTFADYEPGDTAALSHPQGLEYFCGVHLPQARELCHVTAEQAIAQLRENNPVEDGSEPRSSEVHHATGLRRLISWLRP